MADINYPESLPCFLREGYGIEYVSDIKRTVMTTGRSRMRRMFEEVTGSTKVSSLFNDSQAQIFEMWYLYGIESAAWFNAKLKSPLGNSLVECRFISRPQKKLIGNEWKYSFNIEIRNEQVLSEGD